VVAVTEPTVYVRTARRWTHGWELHIADAAGEAIGVTQVRALSRAAAASRTAVQELKDAGLSGSEIAAVLEVSPQRVSQLSSRDSTGKVSAKRDNARKGGRVAGRSTVAGRHVSARSAT
jgi:hypothetical protein